MKKAEPAYVPLTEVAHKLGVGYLAARELLLRHELDGVKRDGRWLVTAESVAEALDER